MTISLEIIAKRAGALRTVLGGAIFGVFMMPLGAAAEMSTLNSGDLAGLEEIEGSGYMEYYEHPDLGSFRFRTIYIEPVTNEMVARQIYDQRFRPQHIDDLAADFHARLLAAFEGTGLLTDTPDENTLVISTALTFVTELEQESTGSHIQGSTLTERTRGSTVMEMAWRAGPGGQLVTAIRDGRAPQNWAPVGDFDDRFTDNRDTFDVWAAEFASMFGAPSTAATN